MTASPNILCLPGLAANARLFAPQLAAHDNAAVPDWPSDTAHPASPDAIATDLLERLESTDAWHERTVLLGFSFGGQIALSIARAALQHQRSLPRGIVLVSAPRTSAQLTRTFNRRASVVASLPAPLLSLLAKGPIAKRFARTLNLNEEHTANVAAMSREMDARQLKQHARASRDWSFTEADHDALAHAGVTVHHIHATRDPVIPPPPKGTTNLTLIDELAHLLTWTHTDAVEASLQRALQGPSAG